MWNDEGTLMLTRGLKFHFYISCSFLLLLLRNLDLRVPFFFKQIFLCCFHSSLMVLCALWIQCGPAAAAESCLTLCDPIDENPPGSSVPGILQARTLEWVVLSFSNAWKWKVKGKPLSRVQLLATPWTIAYQAPPSMGFSKQEYWNGVSFPSPSVVLDLSYFHVETIGHPQDYHVSYKFMMSIQGLKNQSWRYW